jgi:beta-lactamase regulating signal transducer with metallopeptidase domain
MIHQTLMLVWTQAWQIAVLFFAIFILFRLFARNRPHVAHLLWAVLLIKCLIPPVVSSSWAPFSWISHSVQQWLPTDASDSLRTTEYITYTTQRTSSLRTQQSEETSSAQNAEDLSKLNPSWQSYLANTERTLIVFWIGSVAFVIVVWASRFVHVLRRLRLHRIETPARVTKIADDLAQLLKLSRKICVQVSNERIGPAVLGLLRPRILLPSFLVDRMDDEALRILIAHEMTHIRRGDLFWAFLQTVAGSFWWFHPAVWVANRQLNLECERSCDEETIACLECSPSAYAKCLLQVLEWKHQLYVVPSLPGVRPMQITKDRLERIMKMRQGCFKQNTRGLWFAMAVAVLFVAPGAEYGISQQSTTTPQEPANVAKQPSRLPLGGTVNSDLGVNEEYRLMIGDTIAISSVTDDSIKQGKVIIQPDGKIHLKVLDAPLDAAGKSLTLLRKDLEIAYRKYIVSSAINIELVGQAIVERTPPSNASERSTRVYNVADLIERIIADDAANKEDAPKHLERLLTCYESPANPPTGIATLAATPAPVPAPPLPLRESLKPDGEFSLLDGKFVATTSEANHQRISAELVQYRQFGFKIVMQQLQFFMGTQEIPLEGIQWQRNETCEWAILDPEAVNKVRDFVTANVKVMKITRPTVVSRNGEASGVYIGIQHAIKLSEVDPRVLPTNDELVETGIKAEITAELQSSQTVNLSFQLLVNELWPAVEDGSTDNKQFLISKTMKTKVSVPNGKVLAIRSNISHPSIPKFEKRFFGLVEPKELNANKGIATEKLSRSSPSNSLFKANELTTSFAFPITEAKNGQVFSFSMGILR